VDFVELPQSVLNQVVLREKIQDFILSGKLDEAIEHLNKYFPQVLSFKSVDSATTSSCSGLEYVTSKSVDPEHILLNLRILAFIEACRTVPLPYPPSQSPVLPSPTSVSTSKKRSSGCLDEEDPECQEQQTALLKSAQKLYALANVITDATHKSTYLKELANVGGLLAYKVPEESPVSKYLSQERREAVAEQVNSAILHSLGLPTMSYVEFYTRYTTTVWSFLHELDVKLPADAPRPPGSMSQVKGGDTAPQFNLGSFLDTKA